MVNIILLESDTAMHTQRILNQTLLFFIGSLLGSVFGLMGIFAILMSYAENLYDIYYSRKLLNLKIKKFKFSTKEIRTEFDSPTNPIKKSRIAPIHDSVTTTFQGVDKDY